MGFIEVKDGWVQERLETLDFQALFGNDFWLVPAHEKQRPQGFLTETGQYIVLGRFYPQCLFEVWWSICLGMENASMDMPPK